nr:HU family DNA-binding protein [Nitrospira sp.]
MPSVPRVAVEYTRIRKKVDRVVSSDLARPCGMSVRSHRSAQRALTPLSHLARTMAHRVRGKEHSMGKPLTKSQIAEHLAEKSGLTKRAMVQFLDELAALAYREAKNVFTLPGLGKLKLANRKARIGRNPQTGKEIKIPAKRVVKFRVVKAAKDAILGKK